MASVVLSPSELDKIVKKTIESIEAGKKQIFIIAEEARNEWDTLEHRLNALKQKVKATIQEVDTLENLEKDSRQRLMLVSKNFKNYSEEDIKRAYDHTKDLQIKLALKRDHEQQLIAQRTELELQIRKMKDTLERAEQLVSHVAVAMSYLTVTLSNLSGTLEDLQHKEMLGVRIIIAQEEERQRLARDIHDGPAQLMSNIVLKSEICEKLIDVDIDRAKAELKDLKKLIRSSLQDVRKIIFDLRPMSLDDLGLIPTLQRYISNFTDETGIMVDFYPYNNDAKIESVVEVAVFRIIQESLNNIKKYAKAANVSIHLNVSANKLSIIVNDNGIGFDTAILQAKREKSDQNSGFGIYSMKQRAELLNGQFSISSQIGAGTRVHAQIPVKYKEGEDIHEQD